MAGAKYDYRDSGLSTVQSLDDIQGRITKDSGRLSKLYARLVMRFFIMSMSCDGRDCHRVGKTNGRPNTAGVWPHSGGWVHKNDLDFCRTCQFDGSMHAAISAGTRPRGA
jgi:hypothetical protein